MWTAVWSKRRWLRSLWGRIPQTEEKTGTKRSIFIDEKGLSLAVILSGANTHDVKLLADTLDGVIISRPEPNEEAPQNLCLGAGYTGRLDEVEARGYIAHIRPRAEEKKELERNPHFRARRCVVEVLHSFLYRFRGNCWCALRRKPPVALPSYTLPAL